MFWVLGHKGQLGSAIVEELKKNNQKIVTSDFDLTDFDKVSNFFSQNADIKNIINCAAFTHVDAAEGSNLNWKVNAYLPYYLGKMIYPFRGNCRLIHFSTDYVYNDDGSLDPVNDYGRAKLTAEILLDSIYANQSQQYTCKIIRVQNLCSEKKGIIKFFFDAKQKSLPVVIDPEVLIKPTSVYLLAKDVVDVLSNKDDILIDEYASILSIGLAELANYIGVEYSFGKTERPAKRLKTVSLYGSHRYQIRATTEHIEDILERL